MPETIPYQNPVTPIRIRPLVSMPRISTPIRLPKTVPRPPNSPTPPMITPAITCSSKPLPPLNGELASRPNWSAAARATNPPVTMKQVHLMRRVTGGLDLFHRDRRSEEHTSELQSLRHLVCRLLLEKKKKRDMPR